MWSELKAFLLRGDVITLAVAFIIGGAFNQIVTSLVSDVVTPAIGMIGGNPDFSNIAIGAKMGPDGKPEGGIMIGKFINAVVNFLIVGTVLFFLIKAAGKKAEDVK
jgi:large conductance mechanosensitive channel